MYPFLRLELPKNPAPEVEIPRELADVTKYPGRMRIQNGLIISSIKEGSADIVTMDPYREFPDIVTAQEQVLAGIIGPESSTRSIKHIYGGTGKEIADAWKESISEPNPIRGALAITNRLSGLRLLERARASKQQNS